MNVIDREYFDGDIIITDPCYIIPQNRKQDWHLSEYGRNLEDIGIYHYLSENTWDDWSCEVFTGTAEHLWVPMPSSRKIGEFCADSANVAVILLKDVLEYNPDFNWFETKPWTTALIRNFKGFVDIVRTNDPDGDYSTHVIGFGNRNFFSRETFWSKNLQDPDRY